MKTTVTAILFSLLLAPILALAKPVNIDPAHTSVTFAVKHLKVVTIPGRFNQFTGAINLDEKDFMKSKVDFTVDVASIDTSMKKRDDHLRSPDFFDAQKHPRATFKSTSIKKSGAHYTLNGDLTIRGVTKNVAFVLIDLGKVQDPTSNTEKRVFSATGTINRKDFGVSYGPDAVVSDKVELSINLEAI